MEKINMNFMTKNMNNNSTIIKSTNNLQMSNRLKINYSSPLSKMINNRVIKSNGCKSCGK